MSKVTQISTQVDISLAVEFVILPEHNISRLGTTDTMYSVKHHFIFTISRYVIHSLSLKYAQTVS